MTRSMTAFARQQSVHAWGTLVWEIRSVNHRYLEPGFRLPESLRHLETSLRDQLRQQVSRGKVDAQLKFTPGKEYSNALQINEGLLKELQKACMAVKKISPGVNEPGALDLLKWQGVIQEEVMDISSLEQESLKLFDQALAALVTQRGSEGAHLHQHIIDKLEKISTIVAQIRSDMPGILKAQGEKLASQAQDLEVTIDPSRLEQEVILLTQKSDITEEVDRLDTHVLEVKRVLDQQNPVGRRLDFLMQELNREANTVCSKAIVTDTTLGAVELKVLIEQMREQVQNIE